jgi:phosphate transport system permease protein
VVLAIMALPTIITISEDAMRNTPRAMKASLALGASIGKRFGGNSIFCIWDNSGCHIRNRAIGETIAVLMVTGNAAVIPHTF